MVLVPELVDLEALAPAGVDVLLPCRARAWPSTARPRGTSISAPPVTPGSSWAATGREIHRWFYGADAERRCLPSCSGRRADDRDDDSVVLTKCCLLEDRIELESQAAEQGAAPRVVVPWGATLDQVRTALRDPRRGGRAGMGARLTDSAEYAHLWGTDEVRADLRSGRPPAGVDRHPGGAGGGPGGAGHHPAVVVGGHRRARLWRSSRPRSGGGRDAAHLPLHAGLHRGVEGDPACRCRRARVLRRHRAGPDRHVDGAGVPARDGHRLAGPAYARPAPGRVGPHASIHGHGRSDPCPARRAGDVRLEGGVVGRRGRPAPRPPGRRPSALARGPARRRGGHAGLLRR